MTRFETLIGTGLKPKLRLLPELIDQLERCALLGRSSRIFFKKGLGRHGKGPEKVHIKPVMNQTPDVLDLEALSLQDIVWAQLHNLLCSQLSSSKLALWPELLLKLHA